MKVIALIDPCCSRAYATSSLGQDRIGGTESTILRVATALGHRFRFNVFQSARTQIEQDPIGQLLPLMDFTASHLADHDAIIVINSWKVALKARKLAPETPIVLWMHTYPGRHNRKMGPALAAADIGIVCVSQTHAEDVAKFLGDRTEEGPLIQHIYNPVADDLRPDTTERDTDRLLFASAPHKGLDEVYAKFDALRQERPNLVLEVADPGYLAWDVGVPPRGVQLLGSLSHYQLIGRMRAACCLFYPQTSFAETFGLVIAEANAVGTPALVHQGLGANNEIVSSPDQRIDANSLSQITGRLDAWRANPPDIQAQEQFRLARVGQEWERYLEQLIRSAGAQDRKTRGVDSSPTDMDFQSAC